MVDIKNVLDIIIKAIFHYCRVFFANYTSGLLAVNSTLLAYAGNAGTVEHN